jgi:two-component system, OmpR family, sensor histidine kinase VicK
MIDVKAIKEERIYAKDRGVKFRYITDITKENISYCKQMIKEFDAELRHLNAVKGNFEISDGGKEYVATANLQKAKPLKQLIYSNVKEIGEQQQYVFNTLWNKAIPSDEKIKEIEEEILPEVTEIIRNSDEAQSMEWHLLDATKEEIQIIYSTVKAYKLQESLGVMDYLAKLSNIGIKVRLLTPKDSSIEESLANLKATSTIDIKYLETETGIKNKYLITDRKNSLVIELNDKDDNYGKNYYYYLRQKEDENFTPTTSPQASTTILGTSIYSNSKSTVLSYLSVFETLWRQTELLEELKQADILKTEFINVAAHELRTPTQSIIGYCEMLEAFPEKKDAFINPIKRNSERLYKLTEDILDVAKIESDSLKLDIEKVELNEILNETVAEFFSKSSHIKKDVKINFFPVQSKIFTLADKNRIQQVIFNLLDNASKFTEKGEISISIEKHNDHAITIRIQDTGKGIDSEILPRLFEKFATKSERGTGLGLYISKNIVEAHGGRIWIGNNNNNNNLNDGKGTVFLFTLPLTNNYKK